MTNNLRLVKSDPIDSILIKYEGKQYGDEIRHLKRLLFYKKYYALDKLIREEINKTKQEEQQKEELMSNVYNNFIKELKIKMNETTEHDDKNIITLKGSE